LEGDPLCGGLRVRGFGGVAGFCVAVGVGAIEDQIS
jgi:hypothetical protein